MSLKYSRIQTLGPFLVSLLPQVISALAALMTIRIFSELLSPEQMGQVMLGFGAIALLDALFSSSVAQSTFYFTNQQNGRLGVEAILARVWSYTRWTFFPLCLVVYLCLQEPIHGVLERSVIFVLVGSIYLAIEPLRAGYSAILNASVAKRRYGVQVVIDALLMLALTTLALYLRSDVLGLVCGVTLAKGLALIIVMHAVHKTRESFGSKVEFISISKKVTYKIFIKNTFPFFGMGAIGWAASFADRYAVALSGGFIASGVYAIATGLLGRPFNILSASFTTHFRPGLFAQVASGEVNSAKASLFRWAISALGLGLLGVAMIWRLDHTVVTLLLASEYREAVLPLLPVLGLALTMTIVTHSFDNLILSFGKSRDLLFVQVSCVPVMLIALGIGCYLGGAVGAAYGRLLSETIRLFAAIFLSFQFLNPKKLVP